MLNLDIKENDAGSVTFPIVPIKLGKVFIKVIATAEILEDGLFGVGVIGPTAFDTVVRSILVVVRPIEVYCTLDECPWRAELCSIPEICFQVILFIYFFAAGRS